MTPEQALVLARRKREDERRAQQDTGLSDWHDPLADTRGYEGRMPGGMTTDLAEADIGIGAYGTPGYMKRRMTAAPTPEDRPAPGSAIDAANRSAELQGTGDYFRPSPSPTDQGRSAKFAEYRADPAWDSGFQAVLRNRDQYTIDDVQGAGVAAVGFREDALMRRGDSGALVDMGRAEALEFLEREMSKSNDINLAGGMR
tara:strand:+ start:942 stop:1541 length:600 start_codon:yes stop_codon:yes gene_type:complete